MAKRKSTKYIVVHVTATPPTADIGVKEITAMHKNRGWSTIGYNSLIRRSGAHEIGRGEDEVGAHVAGFNSISYGISLVGGIDASGKPEFNMTPEQMETLEAELRRLTKKYPNATICGHRDLSPDRDKDGIIEPHEHLKACPCFDVIPWANSRGLPGAPIRGVWDSKVPAPKVDPGEIPDAREVYLQKLLKRAGYEFGPIDGVVGPKTRSALRRFQKAADLSVTGTFDEPTVRRLRDMFEKSANEVAKVLAENVESRAVEVAIRAAAAVEKSKSEVETLKEMLEQCEARAKAKKPFWKFW